MGKATYTQHYSNFIGVDSSSDPRAVARNRLAYAINMWRDYESEQGAAVETFPGFRRVAKSLGLDIVDGEESGAVGAVHGLYHFRSRKGFDYLVVHAGKRLYAFEENALASGDYEEIANRSAIISTGVADNDSTGFIYNNNLYILDGSHYLTVTAVDGEGTTIKASAVDAYVPTTYYNGNVYEQRNMLTNTACQVETGKTVNDSTWVTGCSIHYRQNKSGEYNWYYRSLDYIEIPIYEMSTAIKGISYEGEECISVREAFGEPYYNDEAIVLGDILESTFHKYFESTGYNGASGWIEGYADRILFNYVLKEITVDEKVLTVVDRVYLFSGTRSLSNGKKIEIELSLHPSHFQTIENMKSFAEDNSDYKKTSIEAINGCTKAAVFDGRVFLTGNGELPNTVFYSHRNLTGANDPAYFGVYNYFNDGTGNTPNVDILATPSMLMVMKRDTVQDGSVYYHVGMDNTDSGSADLLPRLYPSTQGAAGLGSAGGGKPSRLSCNFLDDPVFLSKRGLEAVGKETVNLERTITHRSSNVDRLLIREDLSRATMAEWKRYLVICCRGHVYLADSRYMIQHPDGSYQYEWYYLEGLGTYDSYAPRWAYWLDFYPYIELEGAESVSLDNFLTLDGERVGDVYLLHESGELEDGATVMVAPAVHPEDDAHVVDLYYVESDGVKYLVGINGDEKVGVGNFYPATKIVTLGDRLIFGTDNGDICIINTDKRGEAVDGRAVEYDRIDRSYYTFNGVAYRSGCAVRLDDCDAKALKATVCGTTSARFKMMPGSHCKVNISLDGRNWQTLGEAYSSRFDFADIDFGNFSFAENENNVVVFPEMTRGWINKQYYFYSDRYQAPFGLYELSYVYYISGKIRY